MVKTLEGALANDKEYKTNIIKADAEIIQTDELVSGHLFHDVTKSLQFYHFKLMESIYEDNQTNVLFPAKIPQWCIN